MLLRGNVLDDRVRYDQVLAFRDLRSVDAELVEHVWGVTPPARTRGTLQTYVMRLRATLGADNGMLMVTAAGTAVKLG